MFSLYISEVFPNDIELSLNLVVNNLHFLKNLFLFIVNSNFCLIIEMLHVVFNGFESDELLIEVLSLFLAFKKLICDIRLNLSHFISSQ